MNDHFVYTLTTALLGTMAFFVGLGGLDLLRGSVSHNTDSFQIELEGGEFGNFTGNGETCIHQSRTGKDGVGIVDTVLAVGIQTLCLDILLGAVDGQVGDDHAKEGLALVLALSLIHI